MPSRSRARRRRPSTIQAAITCRWAINCAATAAISGSARAASRATSVSPAARRADSASCPAQTAANPAAPAADSARLAHSRSSIGTGSSSPAIATSITALSSFALVPKTSSTVGSATPASAATARIVVPAYPRAPNRRAAAAMIRARVARACCSRRRDRYRRARVPAPAGCWEAIFGYGSTIVKRRGPVMTEQNTAGTGVEDRVARPDGVSYLRIPARDIAESAQFYRAVFGWRLRGSPDAPSFSDGTGHDIGHWRTDLPAARHAGVLPPSYVTSLDDTL